MADWQFPLQREIDEASFARVGLFVADGPMLTGVEMASDEAGIREALYAFTLRFGPRPYIDYINATKALDAGSVSVTGRLMQDGGIVAWCSAYVEMLETPNTILNPAEYFPALQRMEFTDIPVTCAGPAEAAEDLQQDAELDLQWNAQLNLIGDRERREQEYSGTEAVRLEVASGAVD